MLLTQDVVFLGTKLGWNEANNTFALRVNDSLHPLSDSKEKRALNVLSHAY